MMKVWNILLILWYLSVSVACDDGLASEDADRVPAEEPVLLSFDMYEAELTKALGATPLETLADETVFSIYAYKQGDDTASDPLVGEAVYEVQQGKGTGELYLYRGNYDFYLVSNNTNTAPVITGNQIAVGNGVDLMYNTLKGLTVQPNQSGQSSMSVSLPSPFVHLCSLMDLAVKVSGNSPVKVEKLSVTSIEIGGLSPDVYYELDSLNLSAPTNSYDRTKTVTGFTKDEENEKYQNNDPLVLLPVNGTTPLTFKIKLNISYMDNGKEIPGNYVYNVSVPKALLKGMRYKLLFTLTFFGKLTFGDISVTLRDYSRQDISIDGVGE